MTAFCWTPDDAQANVRQAIMRLRRAILESWQKTEWRSVRLDECLSWRELAQFRTDFWQDVDENLARGKLPGVTPRSIDYLGTPLDEMNFTVRTTNCLKSANLLHLKDVVEREEKELLTIPNLGRKSLNEVRETLTQAGLTFGFSVMGTLS